MKQCSPPLIPGLISGWLLRCIGNRTGWGGVRAGSREGTPGHLRTSKAKGTWDRADAPGWEVARLGWGSEATLGPLDVSVFSAAGRGVLGRSQPVAELHGLLQKCQRKQLRPRSLRLV